MFLLLLCAGCTRSSECVISGALIEQVGAARGLALRSPVSCRVERRGKILRSLKEQIVKSVSPERYKYEGEVFRLLGIIPPRFNYPDQVAALYARGMRARYVADERSIVLTEMSLGPGQDQILAHELIHALQDQFLPLRFVLSPALTHDQALARAALLEGDAIISSNNLGAEEACSSMSRESIMRLLGLRTGKAALGVEADASRLQLVLDFPYIFGPAYYCARRSDGGGADVLASLPNSSAEIMQKVGVVPPSSGESVNELVNGSAAKNELFSDSLGQFTLLAILAAELPLSQSLEAAEALQFDRIALRSNGLIWKIQCVSEARAEILAGTLEQLTQKHRRDLSPLAGGVVTRRGRTVELEIVNKLHRD